MSRQWRDLKLRKWFGFGHEPDKTPSDGDMALPCLSCPKIGLNMTEEENNQNAIVGVMLDGNFHAEHLRPRRADDDVPINEGTGFMVRDDVYQKHLAEAKESKDVRRIPLLCDF